MMADMAAELMAEALVPAITLQFDEWMRTEQRRVFLLCWRMLSDTDEADTATQDAFLKAYRAIDKLPQEADDRARWLTRIAVNTCLDRLRSRRWQFWRKRAEANTEDAVMRDARTRSPGAEDRVFANQLNDRLEKALERLSPRQKSIFLLRHYEDRSIEEIADMLQLDSGSVKSHMFRATSKLRAELEDLYYQRKP